MTLQGAEGAPSTADATPIVEDLARQIGNQAVEIAMLRSELRKVTSERDQYREQATDMARLAARVDELEREELSGNESERVAGTGDSAAEGNGTGNRSRAKAPAG